MLFTSVHYLLISLFLTIVPTRAEYTIFGHSFNVSFSTDAVPVWHAEPPRRGSYSLISSCILTLALCVWSVLHLSIPPDKDHRRQFLYKLGWVLWGIFLPEYLAVVAFRQNRAATKCIEDVAKSLDLYVPPTQVPWYRGFTRKPLMKKRSFELRPLNDSQKPVKGNEYIPWTKEHGFYATMGGFALDTRASGNPFLSRNRTRAGLTPEGICYLIENEPNLMPPITKQEINDKSKANVLGKALACIQLIWFGLQCFARMGQALPISLLEYNTIAHALCALVVYILWWHKPLDIQEPTLIPLTNDRLAATCAHMWMSSGDSSQTRGGDPLPEFACLKYDPSAITTTNTNTGTSESSSLSPPLPSEALPSFPITLTPATNPGTPGHLIQRRTGFSLDPHAKRFYTPPRGQAGNGSYAPARIVLQAADIRRWDLASRAIRTYGLPPPSSLVSPRSGSKEAETDANLLVLAAPVSPPGSSVFKFQSWCLTLTVSVIFGLYGGVHALAWDYPFVSPAEQFYWRVAVVFLCAPALFLPLFAGLGGAVEGVSADAIIPKKMHPVLGRILSRVLTSVTIVMLLAISAVFFVTPLLIMFCYFPARIYVVIMSFKDVFYLPEEAFLQPSWTGYFPHIA